MGLRAGRRGWGWEVSAGPHWVTLVSPEQGRKLLAVLVTAVTHEDGTHHFIIVTKLDDVQITYYSSDTRELRATQEWAEQALGAEYLQEKTQKFWTYDKDSKGGSELSLSPAGIHTAQAHVGCSLSDQAPVDPRFQYAFDGRDFISFDNQTGTWVAAVQPAFLQKQRWETVKTWTQYVQRYLQYECLETLRRLVQRLAPHEITGVRHRGASVTLSCRARGFYPRPIHVSWVRDGEDILAETDSSGILPNTDGTYYMQSSLEISPQQDGHRYACRVKHSSLGEPTLIWEQIGGSGLQSGQSSGQPRGSGRGASLASEVGRAVGSLLPDDLAQVDGRQTQASWPKWGGCHPGVRGHGPTQLHHVPAQGLNSGGASYHCIRRDLAATCRLPDWSRLSLGHFLASPRGVPRSMGVL
uniref:Ig-like domain-containing protein n=1 Tax=Terrapene triunguis TaxID=2587831 RepID=A0A674JTX4_9SAUR